MIIDNRVRGTTRLIGVIGNPIEHTISPQLHNSLSVQTASDLVYIPMKVEKEGLENAVKGLKAINFLGFNVTIPYKKDIMKFIDENSREALLMGAVNTVKNINGRFYGYNTDAEGFSRSFKEEVGSGFKGKKVFIIGAGGVARAIAVKVAMEEAQTVYIVNRTASKASDVADIVNNNISGVASVLSFDDIYTESAFKDSDIIINTTSVGMHPDNNGLPIPNTYKFNNTQVVYDVIYNPVKTKLLKKAEKCGCKILNGLGMLFYQGIYAYEIWTGIKLQDDLLKDIYQAFSEIIKK